MPHLSCHGDAGYSAVRVPHRLKNAISCHGELALRATCSAFNGVRLVACTLENLDLAEVTVCACASRRGTVVLGLLERFADFARYVLVDFQLSSWHWQHQGVTYTAELLCSCDSFAVFLEGRQARNRDAVADCLIDDFRMNREYKSMKCG